jgi:hypothetical protein
VGTLMYSHEFMAELGAFIRALESQIRQHPELKSSDKHDVMDDLDQAIVSLIAVRMKLFRSLQDL